MDSRYIGMGAALCSAASWALGSILFKRVSEKASPLAMTLCKGLASMLVLGLLLVFVKHVPVPKEAILWLAVSGLVGIALGDTLFFASLRDLGPVTVIVFFMLGQLLTAVMGVTFLGEILSAPKWLGIALTLIGIGLVLWPQVMADSDKQKTTLRGIGLGALSMLCMSASSIIAKPELENISTLSATFIRMSAGTAGMALFGLATRRVGEWLVPFREPKFLTFFLMSVTIVSIGGFWLGIVAIKYVDVAIASTLGAVEPLFVVPLAMIVLKERISGWTAIGATVTVGGVLVLLMSK